jgi:23S rRNA (adenine2503-C2)-methyltransferase
VTAEPLPLVFRGPRRAKPPRHLGDLTPVERRDAVLAFGEPAYRARQLSTHYFRRFVADAEQMSDLPST